MMPDKVKTLFWNVDLDTFTPEDHPDYSIFRVLEYGDTEEVDWMRRTFSEADIRCVLRNERRLTRKSANFWTPTFETPEGEVAALGGGQ